MHSQKIRSKVFNSQKSDLCILRSLLFCLYDLQVTTKALESQWSQSWMRACDILVFWPHMFTNV